MNDIPVYGRDYQSPSSQYGREITATIERYWGSERPNLGDLVTVVEYYGMHNPCCGFAPKREQWWIGKAVEIAIEFVSNEQPDCRTCFNCQQHYHIMDQVFVYGVCRSGEQDKGGAMVGLHEIRPLGFSWGLGDLNLDPTKDVK